jgi:hypothetical protein
MCRDNFTSDNKKMRIIFFIFLQDQKRNKIVRIKAREFHWEVGDIGLVVQHTCTLCVLITTTRPSFRLGREENTSRI